MPSVGLRDKARYTGPAPSYGPATLGRCWRGIKLSGSSERAGTNPYSGTDDCEPLEMQHSVVQPADALLHRAAVGHFLNQDSTNSRTSFAVLNPSFAPAGTTAMLAAKDLATFALAHVNDGVGINGHRLLSAASARRMRQQTAASRGCRRCRLRTWMDDDRQERCCP